MKFSLGSFGKDNKSSTQKQPNSSSHQKQSSSLLKPERRRGEGGEVPIPERPKNTNSKALRDLTIGMMVGVMGVMVMNGIATQKNGAEKVGAQGTGTSSSSNCRSYCRQCNTSTLRWEDCAVVQPDSPVYPIAMACYSATCNPCLDANPIPPLCEPPNPPTHNTMCGDINGNSGQAACCNEDNTFNSTPMSTPTLCERSTPPKYCYVNNQKYDPPPINGLVGVCQTECEAGVYPTCTTPPGPGQNCSMTSAMCCDEDGDAVAPMSGCTSTGDESYICSTFAGSTQTKCIDVRCSNSSVPLCSTYEGTGTIPLGEMCGDSTKPCCNNDGMYIADFKDTRKCNEAAGEFCPTGVCSKQCCDRSTGICSSGAGSDYQ